MNLMPRSILAPLAALLLAPAAADAITLTYQCPMSHLVRSAGTEMVSTVLTVRNADASNAATILRLTIRDGDGAVVHDSGPLTGTPLPLNTDYTNTYPTGRDITQVPRGGAVYLRTNHIWGNSSLPGATGNETGQILSASLVVAKEGQRSALTVGSTQRMRTRVPGSVPGTFSETDTRATSALLCEPLP